MHTYTHTPFYYRHRPKVLWEWDLSTTLIPVFNRYQLLKGSWQGADFEFEMVNILTRLLHYQLNFSKCCSLFIYCISVYICLCIVLWTFFKKYLCLLFSYYTAFCFIFLTVMELANLYFTLGVLLQSCDVREHAISCSPFISVLACV